MNQRKANLWLAALATLSTANALAAPTGRTANFTSPNGVTESCIAIEQMPGGKYKKKDLEKEALFCKIDMYDGAIAVCPKSWSTSAGTMIYGTEGTGETQAQYEASAKCGQKDGHENKIAKFKSTMNASGTSGTFAPSSLLYYHFSRYLNAEVTVPVAVYRTFDRLAHLKRVSSKGKGNSRMNIAAWEIMRTVEKNPAAYSPTDELFTPDRKQIFGVILKDKGERYGAEFNGTRASGWGVGQNNDFQKTPGFMALRSESALEKAVVEGVAASKKDPLIVKALGSGPLPAVQVVYWMRELTEITIMDYIFSQQDRVGNIDYEWKWVYVDGGEVKDKDVKGPAKDFPRTKMSQIPVPPELAPFKPILVQRSSIGDNDAGGRVQYANFTKKTEMIQKIRHIAGDTYRRLIHLAADLRSKGELYQHIAKNFTLSPKQIDQIVVNTQEVASILKKTCEARKLRFDLNPEAMLLGQNTEESVDCSNP